MLRCNGRNVNVILHIIFVEGRETDNDKRQERLFADSRRLFRYKIDRFTQNDYVACDGREREQLRVSLRAPKTSRTSAKTFRPARVRTKSFGRIVRAQEGCGARYVTALKVNSRNPNRQTPFRVVERTPPQCSQTNGRSTPTDVHVPADERRRLARTWTDFAGNSRRSRIVNT